MGSSLPHIYTNPWPFDEANGVNRLAEALGAPSLHWLGALGGGSTPVSPSVNALAAHFARPRNRSEWQARFAHWQRPASDTEEAKIDAMARRIGDALRRSDFLQSRRWRIAKQGSYHNNTNVRTDSDMDIGVCLMDAFFVDGPPSDVPSSGELRYEPLAFRFDDYKYHIAGCLEQEFGRSVVTIGKKAIHLHKESDEKIHADVVPAFTFQLYGPRLGPSWSRGNPQNGIGLLANGSRITNFPDQHYANGCAKNDRTGRRYKRVARILKRLRNHVELNTGAPAAMRSRAEKTASFLIESLVYNCPDYFFGNAEIYDDVAAVLHYLSLGLNDPGSGQTLLNLPAWAFWYEVNGIKTLFGAHQAWAVADAAAFIGDARAYMEV